jgi:hypothetical protein
MTQETQDNDTSPQPVAVNDIVVDARQWLDDSGSLKRLQTHSGNCHQWHVSCLVVKMIREIELQRACTSAGRDEIARLRGGWTQVQERLPPEGEWVLWWSPDDDICQTILAARDGNSLDFGGDLNLPLTGITHWRHLPDPVS